MIFSVEGNLTIGKRIKCSHESTILGIANVCTRTHQLEDRVSTSDVYYKTFNISGRTYRLRVIDVVDNAGWKVTMTATAEVVGRSVMEKTYYEAYCPEHVPVAATQPSPPPIEEDDWVDGLVAPITVTERHTQADCDSCQWNTSRVCDILGCHVDRAVDLTTPRRSRGCNSCGLRVDGGCRADELGLAGCSSESDESINNGDSLWRPQTHIIEMQALARRAENDDNCSNCTHWDSEEDECILTIRERVTCRLNNNSRRIDRVPAPVSNVTGIWLHHKKVGRVI